MEGAVGQGVGAVSPHVDGVADRLDVGGALEHGLSGKYCVVDI